MANKMSAGDGGCALHVVHTSYESYHTKVETLGTFLKRLLRSYIPKANAYALLSYNIFVMFNHGGSLSTNFFANHRSHDKKFKISSTK